MKTRKQEWHKKGNRRMVLLISQILVLLVFCAAQGSQSGSSANPGQSNTTTTRTTNPDGSTTVTTTTTYSDGSTTTTTTMTRTGMMPVRPGLTCRPKMARLRLP